MNREIAMVMASLTRHSVVSPPCGQRGSMERHHFSVIASAKCKMHQRYRTTRLIDPKFAGRKIFGTFLDGSAIAKCMENCAIERLARTEVANPKMHMIDQ